MNLKAAIKAVVRFLKAHITTFKRVEPPAANGQDDPNYKQVSVGIKIEF